MPAVFSASSVMWVYAPPPETSSSPPLAPADPRAVAPVGARASGSASMPMIGLMPRPRGLLVEVVGAEEVAVVGHREGRHAHRRRPRRTGRRGAPHRRAWSTRCARAGARTSRRMPCGDGASDHLGGGLVRCPSLGPPADRTGRVPHRPRMLGVSARRAAGEQDRSRRLRPTRQACRPAKVANDHLAYDGERPPAVPARWSTADDGPQIGRGDHRCAVRRAAVFGGAAPPGPP